VENIFEEQRPEISVNIGDTILKPERSAFIFILPKLKQATGHLMI
jgi:hypothetical protein